jgi:hypothetical protein
VRDDEAGVSEPSLFAHPFAVGGEVAEQVRPADLTAGRVEVVVGAPAVGADDPVVAFAEHRLGLGGVPAGRDPEHRGSAGDAPQSMRRLPPVDAAVARALELYEQKGNVTEAARVRARIEAR